MDQIERGRLCAWERGHTVPSDLANSFQVVRKMRLIPLDLETFVPLIAGAVVPMLPLVLISFPLEEIVAKVLRLVL